MNDLLLTIIINTKRIVILQLQARNPTGSGGYPQPLIESESDHPTKNPVTLIATGLDY